MSRITFGFLVLAQSLISVSSFAAAKPFLACSTSATNTTAAVQLEVSRPYNDSIVRVAIREQRANGIISSLNDLTPAKAQEQGVFENQMFRLKVSSDVSTGRIEFFYDNGVRASADLICTAK